MYSISARSKVRRRGAVTLLAVAVSVISAKSGEHRHTVNRTLVGLASVTAALAAADVEATQRCLAVGTCREMNPLVPKSRVGAYAVEGSVMAGVVGVAYALKRHSARGWWAPLIAASGAHAVGLSLARGVSNVDNKSTWYHPRGIYCTR